MHGYTIEDGEADGAAEHYWANRCSDINALGIADGGTDNHPDNYADAAYGCACRDPYRGANRGTDGGAYGGAYRDPYRGANSGADGGADGGAYRGAYRGADGRAYECTHCNANGGAHHHLTDRCAN